MAEHLASPWIASDGGPLIVVPHESLDQWGGSDACFTGDAPTDYHRACIFAGEYISRIDIRGRDGLVMGEVEENTCWQGNPDGASGMLIRIGTLGHDDDEEDPNFLKQIDLSLVPAWKEAGWRFVASGGPLLMFPAYFSGDLTEIPSFQRAEFQLPPGAYRILTGFYRREEVSLVLHRLLPVNA